MKILKALYSLLLVFFAITVWPLKCHPLSSNNSSITKELSELNKEALIDCLEKRYEKALDIFKNIIGDTWEHDIKELSIALWGRLICDACLENWEAMLLDIEILDSLIDTCCTNCYTEKIQVLCVQYPSFFNNPSSFNDNIYYKKVNSNNHTGFANPNKELSPYECCQRMRLFQKELEKMIRDKFKQKESTPENNYALHKISDFIIKIARRGENCCYKGTHWTVCCSPINQIWRTWKKHRVPNEVPNQ